MQFLLCTQNILPAVLFCGYYNNNCEAVLVIILLLWLYFASLLQK